MKKSLHYSCFPINFAKYFRIALLCKTPVNNWFFVSQQDWDKQVPLNVKIKTQAKGFRAPSNIWNVTFFGENSS